MLDTKSYVVYIPHKYNICGIYMNKQTRHKEIIKILSNGKVGSQADLHSKFGAKGISVTQATLSRDLEELGIIKEKGVYRVPDVSEYSVQFGELGSIIPAGDSFLIIKTSPGLANAMAELIDTSKPKSIIGTIAGDNTILVALAKGCKQSESIKEISKLLNSRSRPRRRSR